MRDRYDPIDAPKLVEQPVLLGGFRDEARNRGRAVHAGQNADVISDADASIGSLVSVETSLRLVPEPARGTLGRCPQIGDLDVLDMHMTACGDIHPRDPNHLT